MDKRELYEQIMTAVAKEVKKAINEAYKEVNEGECGCACPPGAPGGMGGACMPFNTPMNTIGVGNIVPAGIHSLGSGDRFMSGLFPIYTKSSGSGKKKSKKRKNNRRKYKK